MDIQLTAKDVFALSPQIEVTVCGNTRGERFFLEIRPGSKMPEFRAELQSLYQYQTEQLTEFHRRIIPIAGKTDFTLKQFEAWKELIVTDQDLYLITAWSKNAENRAIEALAGKMHEMLQNAEKPNM